MKTFAVNTNTPYFLKNEGELIPNEFNSPCINDVTDLLVNTHDIKMDISEAPKNNNLCYFCLFIYRKWEPVGWGIINHEDETVTFKNIPDGIAGIPCIYENNIPKKLIPKEYGIQNLWGVELTNFWRMLYTIKGDQVEIICFILEITNHNSYNKIFGYKKK